MKRHRGGPIVLIIYFLLSVGCQDKVGPNIEGLFPPLGAAFSVDGGEVTFFDLLTGEVVDTRVTNGYSISASFAMSGNFLFMTDNHADNVAVYTLPAFEPLASLPNGGVPLDLCINRAATLVYLINANGNLRRYNQIDGEIDTVAVGLHPRRLALTPIEERHVWVACRGDSAVYIVDLNGFLCSDTLQFDKRPSDIRFSPDGNRAYIAVQDFGGIHVFDTHTYAEINVLPAGPGPMDLAIDHDGMILVGSDSTLGRVRVWDLIDHEDWSLNVGGSAGRVRFSRGSMFYVISFDENHVISVNTSSEPPVIADTIYVPPQVRELALWETQP